jgi:hypothetical protein
MDPSLASVGWPVVDRVFGFSPHGVFIAIGFAIGAWLFGDWRRAAGSRSTR